jgi:hypothetical protein
MMARKMNFAISPSQATESLFYAKGDVEKFKTTFDEEDFRRFVKWFYENKNSLRLNRQNYLKISRKANNNSVSVRPSINMINTSDMDENTHRFPAGMNAFSPTTASKYGTRTPMNEVQMRSKIQSMFNDPKLPKIKKQMEASLQEWNLQKQKKGTFLEGVGSLEAQKRLLFKSKRNDINMQKNIDKIIK